MPVLLSDEERCALKGVTDFQFRLYVQGIRPFMDYQTGVVGIKRKVSYQSLAEETYTEPGKGLERTGSKSRDQVKRTIRALEKAGLVIAKSVVTEKKKQLILECVLAITDRSAKNKAAPYPPHSAAPQAAPLHNQENTVNIDTKQDIEEESRPGSRPTQNEKAAPPPISGKYITKLYSANDLKSLSEFKNLLNEQGFRPEQILSVKTMAMLNAWVDAGVTLEEATVGIESVNAKRKPEHPTYYKNPVMQVKSDFEKAKSEATNVQPKPTPTNQQRHKSATQSFYDDTIGAIERNYRNREQD